MNKRKIKKIPIADASTPKRGLFMVYVDSYWVVTPDREIILYDGSPQCNQHAFMAMHLQRRLYPDYATERLPLIFIRHECER